MLSENDNKNLVILENVIKLAKNKINDSQFIYNTFSDLVLFCEKIEDSNLKFNIEKKAKELLVIKDQNKIKKYLEEFLPFISKFRETHKNYLDINLKEDVSRSDRYKTDCLRYPDKNIQTVEKRILESPVYQKKLHEFLKEGNWKKRYHARLDDNLRIIYSWDKEKKKIKFEAIVTHDEL